MSNTSVIPSFIAKRFGGLIKTKRSGATGIRLVVTSSDDTRVKEGTCLRLFDHPNYHGDSLRWRAHGTLLTIELASHRQDITGGEALYNHVDIRLTKEALAGRLSPKITSTLIERLNTCIRHRRAINAQKNGGK